MGGTRADRVASASVKDIAGAGGKTAAEAAGKLGKIGDLGGVGKAALGVGAVAAGGFALNAAIDAYGSKRERDFAKMVSEGMVSTSASLRASLDQEAAGGGAWADPSWPTRMHGMVTFRSGSKPVWAADVAVRSKPEDYTREELRAAWLRYMFANGAALERNLYLERQAEMERHLRQRTTQPGWEVPGIGP